MDYMGRLEVYKRVGISRVVVYKKAIQSFSEHLLSRVYERSTISLWKVYGRSTFYVKKVNISLHFTLSPALWCNNCAFFDKIKHQIGPSDTI